MAARKQPKTTVAPYNANTYLQLGKSFNIHQKRIIHFVVKQLQDELFNLNDQKKQGRPIERTLFGDAYFHIPANIIDPLNQDTEIRKAIKGLQIPIDDKNFIGNFILSGKREEGDWRLLFPEKTVHFLTEVSKGVTPLQTIIYLTAKSIFTIRMYELLMRFRDTGKWFPTVDELHELLDTPASYRKNTAFLKMRIIDVAQKELKDLYDKKQSEIFFTYDVKQGGRGNKVLRYNFTIIWSGKGKLNNAQAKDLEFVSLNLCKLMIDNVAPKYKKANRLFMDKALAHLISSAQLVKFSDRLERFIKKNSSISAEQQGCLIRYILEEDFGVVAD